ncbi:MAG: DUF3500 domain-containing protein [Planctomycetota bacterium]|jgi:hypothetical protein
MRHARSTPLALFIALAAIPGVSAQHDRADYVSDASHIVGTYDPGDAEHTPEAMAAAATRLLASFDDVRHRKVAYDLSSDERKDWTNLPARRESGGIPLGECTTDQVRAACALMASIFSRQGFEKMRDIMLADDQLLRDGRARQGFGTEEFAIVVFGTPSATEPWAFQIDGHHVGVNVAIHGHAMTMSPSFIGTQPDTFTIGSRTVRPLAGEVDDAFALVNGLSEVQRRAAIVSERRQQVRTGPGHDHEIPPVRGVSCATFDPAQRAALMSLIGRWVNDLPADRAQPRLRALEKEIDRMHFSWSGSTTPNSDVSYAIQGPTLIIEYACQDLGGNPLAHLHTMYRDPTNEYGRQLTHDHDHDRDHGH